VRRGVPAVHVAHGDDTRVVDSSLLSYATTGDAPPARSGCSAKVASIPPTLSREDFHLDRRLCCLSFKGPNSESLIGTTRQAVLV
jgi:hypothetical protein